MIDQLTADLKQILKGAKDHPVITLALCFILCSILAYFCMIKLTEEGNTGDDHDSSKYNGGHE